MYCYDNTALLIVTGPRDRHGEVRQICYEGDTHPNSILAAVLANSECNDFNICNHTYLPVYNTDQAPFFVNRE